VTVCRETKCKLTHLNWSSSDKDHATSTVYSSHCNTTRLHGDESIAADAATATRLDRISLVQPRLDW